MPESEVRKTVVAKKTGTQFFWQQQFGLLHFLASFNGGARKFGEQEEGRFCALVVNKKQFNCQWDKGAQFSGLVQRTRNKWCRLPIPGFVVNNVLPSS